MVGKLEESRSVAAGALPFGQSATLDQLCSSVTRLLGCEAALVLYVVGTVKRILGSDGIPSRFKSYQFDFAQAPYARDERVEAIDVKDGDKLATIGHRLGLETCGFFLREPVITDKSMSVALVALGRNARAKLAKAEKDHLAKITGLIRKEVRLMRAVLANEARHVTVLTSLAVLKKEVTTTNRAEFLLDRDMRVVAVSKSGATLLGQPAKLIVGKHHGDFAVPASGAIAWLYARALATRVSPPEFEIIHHAQSGEWKIFRINISPLSPTDTTDYFLHVTVTDVSEIDAQTQKVNSALRLAKSRGKSPLKEPSMKFLVETLVARRAIRERKKVNFLTLRAWRQSIREYQIEALKALKHNLPGDMALEIAREMATEINSLVGAAAFRAIVPMPCTNAANANCLSREIARSLGTLLDLPVINALSAPQSEASSHPKKNLRRPKMSLVDSVSGPVILVDDVATSGAHVEEAVHLLKANCGAVLPVVWIAGDKV